MRTPEPSFGFTEFETEALSLIARQFGEAEPLFLEQVSSAKVTDRIHTGVGFYTHVSVDRTSCQPLDLISRIGGHFEVAGSKWGVWVGLWSSDGYLDLIEGVTAGDDHIEGIALIDLVAGKYTPG